MLSRVFAKWSRGRSAKVAGRLREAVCLPLEQRVLLAHTIYVDAGSPGSTRDGTSWGNAYADLQLALRSAVSGDTVRVAEGTYKPTSGTDRRISFELTPGVGLYGGYAGHGGADPDAREVAVHQTILSGDIGAAGDNSDNSCHVVSILGNGTDGVAVLDGFTITAGNADNPPVVAFVGEWPDDDGGGMYNAAGNPMLTNCIFSGNSAHYAGGGIFNLSGSPTLINCIFRGNSAYNSGGGLLNVTGNPSLTHCTFTDNSAGAGGGMRTEAGSPRLANCRFSNNSASGGGGGMYNEADGSTLTHCTFDGNSAGSGGGGMYIDSSSPTLTHCAFTGNSANSGGALRLFLSRSTLTSCTFNGNSAANGGGIWNGAGRPTLTNCTFSGNSAGYGDTAASQASVAVQGWHTGDLADGYGGGMGSECDPNANPERTDFVPSHPILTNCTFSGNRARADGGGVYNDGNSSATLTNCILWDNVDATGEEGLGRFAISNSDIQGGWAGRGNINVDPLFFRNPSPGTDGVWGTDDDDYGDLRLHAYSPAVDAGSNTTPGLKGISTDLNGARRFRDVPTMADTGVGAKTIVDMGAYEAVAALDVGTGGPYRVAAGRSITLRGFGASNRAGAQTYAWDLDGDGIYDDATGQQAVFSAAGIQGSVLVTIGLQITDSRGRKRVDSSTVTVLPRVLYVDDSAKGRNDGSSWANAYGSLQSALEDAAAGSEIRMGQGTYKPTGGTDRFVSFELRNGVRIRGGYAGYGETNPGERNVTAYPTVLSGDIGAIGDKTDNSYHVVVSRGMDRSAILDGVTITGGNADGDDSRWLGGGMYNDSSSPTLTNCTFRGNSSEMMGGGIYNQGSSSPTLDRCVFSGNKAVYGGGMYNEASSPTLTNCVLSANTATQGGGMDNDASSPTLTNCVFSGNTADRRHGNAISSYRSSLTLTNCIVWGNGGAIRHQIDPSDGSTTITYSDIQGGWAGVGNLNVDPHFVRKPSPGKDRQWGTADDDDGDLRLRRDSSCIDAGSNPALRKSIQVDLAGYPRLMDVSGVRDPGAIVDMGAYESVGRAAGGAPQIIVTASGPAAMIKSGEAIAVSFGSAGVGAAGASRVFTVSNLSATEEIVFGKITIPAGYQLLKGLQTILEPGNSATFRLNLLTTQIGTHSGWVSFGTNVAGVRLFRFLITGSVRAKKR